MNKELELLKQHDRLILSLYDIEQEIDTTLERYKVIDEKYHKVFLKGNTKVTWKHEAYTDDGDQEFMVNAELCYGTQNAKLHTLKLLNQ